MATTCEERGYKVGDKFRVSQPTGVVGRVCGFQEGQIVTLYRDEGDDIPLFKGDNSRYNHADGKPGAYLHIDLVSKVEDEQC